MRTHMRIVRTHSVRTLSTVRAHSVHAMRIVGTHIVRTHSTHTVRTHITHVRTLLRTHAYAFGTFLLSPNFSLNVYSKTYLLLLLL